MAFKQYFIILFFSLFFINFTTAENGSIKGTVKDSQNSEAIEYASVALINPESGKVLSGVLTNKTGSFSIPNLKSGTYTIKIYFIGYEELLLENVILKDKQNLQLGSVKLKITSTALDEVVVANKKVNSTNKIDKQQYKASQFETAKGGTAIDVIKNLPSVTVNVEGAISVRGSNGFMVLVNGKPVLTDAATILSQIPANTIQNIELITAPTAKYDPDGKGGIINIVTTIFS